MQQTLSAALHKTVVLQKRVSHSCKTNNTRGLMIEEQG